MATISDHIPPTSFLRGGKTVIPYNVVTEQVTDPQTQVTRTQYTYDEAEGVTHSDAQKLADSRVALKLSGVAGMTYAELDAYIETNVTTLATSKTFLKKLAKVVLALVKQS
jgi:hypothetical protein